MALMTKPGRQPCEIIGCKRTAPLTDEDTQIICGKCWRTIPLYMRRRYTLIERRYTALRPLAQGFMTGSPADLATLERFMRLGKILLHKWEALKTAANDAKVGIR